MIGKKTFVWIGIGFLATLCSVGVELGMAMFLQIFIVSLGVVKSNSLPSWFPASLTHISVLFSAFFLVGIGVMRTLSIFFNEFSTFVTEEMLGIRLRLISVQEMLFQEEGRFLSAAEVHFRLSELLPKVTNAIVSLNRFLYYSVLLLALLTGMFVVSFWSTFICVTGLGLLGILVLSLNRIVRERSHDASLQQKELQQGIERVARNWLYVRIARTQEREREELTRSTSRYFVHRIRAVLLNAGSSNLPPMMGVFLLAFVFWFSQNVLQTPGLKLLALFYLFVRFIQILKIASVYMGIANQNWPQVEMAMNFFYALPEDERKQALEQFDRQSIWSREFLLRSDWVKKEKTSLPRLTKAPLLEVEDVEYTYPGASKPVLKQLDMTIQPGSQVGVSGSSGSGKSTLLGLLLGVLEPSKGKVLVNGVPVSEFFDSYDVPMGYVGADPFLIEGSLRDNLLYGCREAVSDTELWDALEKAELAETVRSLPEGLEYRLTENADGLSTGQKQRLSLARALVQKPVWLMLDEASANLDEETETAIASSISHLKGQCTVFIISHRKGMLEFADELYELQAPSEVRGSLKRTTQERQA